VADACVTIVGAARPTSVDSLAALHGPEIAALLWSPLKNARHLYVPTTVGVNVSEAAVAMVCAALNVNGRFAEVKIAVAQAASFGPYSRNSTVATPTPDVTGFESWLTTALSLSEPAPSTIGAEAFVAIAGVAGVTTVVSSSSGGLHGSLTALLFASPL